MNKIVPLNIFLSKSLHVSMHSVIKCLGLPLTKNKSEAFLIIEDISELKKNNSNIIDDKIFLFIGASNNNNLHLIKVFSFDVKLISGYGINSSICLTKNKEKGNIFYLNLNYSYIFNNYVTSNTHFFVKDNLTVNENLVSNNKKRLFDIIEESIMIIFNKSNLPFLHIWQHKKNYNSSFIYRLDCDGSQFGDIVYTLSELKDYSNFISVYINLHTYKKDIDRIPKFKKSGYDIQTHNYFHNEYPTYYHSYNNLKKSCELFNKIGVFPSGYAIPDFTWYPHIIEIAEKLNLNFISSFGFIYDGFPFFHLNKGRISKIIEIPFHPINPNRFKYSNITPDSEIVDDYYNTLINSKMENYELIALYDHPEFKLSKRIGKTTKLFRKIASNSDCNILNVSGYEKWVRNRLNINYSALYDSEFDKIILEKGNYNSFELCIKDESSYYLYNFKNNIFIKDFNRKLKRETNYKSSKLGHPILTESNLQYKSLKVLFSKYLTYYYLSPQQIKAYLLKYQMIIKLNNYKKNLLKNYYKS